MTTNHSSNLSPNQSSGPNDSAHTSQATSNGSAGNNGSAESLATPRDWFVAAIESDGTVAACLDAVLHELHERTSFIRAIKKNLAGSLPSASDALTELGGRIRAFENTLRFRLGMLHPERVGPWFRAPVARNAGPFATALIAEPVLAEYTTPATTVNSVRAALMDRWRERSDENLPFANRLPCLWRTLMTMNREWNSIAKFPEPFSALRFEDLPEKLPTKFESRALRAFLLNVRVEIFAVRERLDACYKQLFDACEKLWAFQIKQEQEKEKEKLKQKPGTKGDSNDSTDSGSAGAPKSRSTDHWSHGAAGMRDDFRKRRQSAFRENPLGTGIRTAEELEALRCMGFEEYPTAEILRHRYLSLAKTYHPDRGGSEEKFKMLTIAYRRLAERK